MKKEYDLIVSLGGSCAEANQLKQRGLRRISLPFDWLFTKESSSLDRLAQCFREDFAHWMEPENLVDIDPSEYDPHAAKYQYRDTYTGYRFIHDFIRPKEQSSAEVAAKYKRRIERLYGYLRAAKRIAICFDADYEGCEDPLVRLRDVLLERFGKDKQIDAYLVQFKAEKYAVVQNGFLNVFRFPHPKPLYVFGNYPTFEFAYMDDIILSDMFKSDERGKGGRLYLAHTAHGIKCVLFMNKPRKFGMTLLLGTRKYEFAWGGGVA